MKDLKEKIANELYNNINAYLSYISKYKFSNEEKQDIISESYIKMSKYIDKYPDTEIYNLFGFIIKSIKYVCLDFYKKRKHLNELKNEYKSTIHSYASHDPVVQEFEFKNAYLSHSQSLGIDPKLAMAIYERDSEKDIKQNFNINKGRLFKEKRKLKKSLANGKRYTLVPPQ